MTAVHYNITAGTPSQVSLKDLSRCIGLVKAGEAVDPDSAAVEIPRAQLLAIPSAGKLIVGVGAIKRRRPGYSLEIADRSGVSFDPNTSELGYVAVDPQNRGQRLSGRIVQELLSHHEGALFATTSSERMEKTLAHAGVVQMGSEWEGRKNQRLSFWIRET